jgi:hypothetical protein
MYYYRLYMDSSPAQMHNSHITRPSHFGLS